MGHHAGSGLVIRERRVGVRAVRGVRGDGVGGVGRVGADGVGVAARGGGVEEPLLVVGRGR